MFKVRATVPGVFCLSLEDGAINMRPGQEINIESYCSRKWIETDPEFRSLIDRKNPPLQVVFDSEKSILPKTNLTTATQRKVSAKVQSIPPTASLRVIPSSTSIPLAKVPEPTSDEPIVIDLATNKVSPPQKEIVLEPETIKIEDVNKRYSESELRKLNLNDLKLLAANLEIKVVPPISKIRIIKLILKKYEET